MPIGAQHPVIYSQFSSKYLSRFFNTGIKKCASQHIAYEYTIHPPLFRSQSPPIHIARSRKGGRCTVMPHTEVHHSKPTLLIPESSRRVTLTQVLAAMQT